MTASAIRSLACGRESRVVAAAFVERTVQIWEIDSCRLISQFDTVYDFGCKRLGISPRGDRCVCAAWASGARGGVACYDSTSGQALWRCSELKQTQRVRFSPSGESAWWMPETGPTMRLNATNGVSETLVRGAGEVFEDPYSKALFIAPRNKNKPCVFGESRGYRVERRGFAVLDVAFAAECFCLTEAGGPTRCFSSAGQGERWCYEPAAKSHILQIRFIGALHAFFAVLYGFESGLHSLVRLDPTSGECTLIRELRDICAFCFCEALGVLVTSAGDLVRIHDGTNLGRLNFPQKEYPD